MTTNVIRLGFLPLVDAALPILARELGFAEEQGIALDLVRDMSWATVRDRLVYGRTDAAHLLAPLAIAATLGLDRPARRLSVPFVLGLNGNAITLRNDLAAQVSEAEGLTDPVVAGARPKRVFVGVETNPDVAPTKLTFGAVPGGKGAAALEVAFKETAEDLGKEIERIRSVVVIGV